MMLSLHGLVRGRDPELGRDADTGGQVTYVLDLARALGRHPDIAQVDLLTRLIQDPSVSADYGAREEALGGRARIVRLPFGPRRYLRKELLWRHLDQLVDRCLGFFQEQGRLPDLIHSHYADAAYVGVALSQSLAIPQVHTGHSLGRVKRERLLAAGRKASALERQFSFERRIAAEEAVLEHASLIVASTHQEIREQYALYESFDPRRAAVIPPGADLSRFAPPAQRVRETGAAPLLDLRQRGAFVDEAVSEPFGLTILEAAASGLPVVVTRHYTWKGHVSKYLKAARRLLHRERKQIRRRIAYTRPEAGARLRPFRYALITDIDETLVGGVAGLRALLAWLSERREDVVFGVATGRVLGLAIGVLEDWRVPVPDVLVTAVGTEIHYGPDLVPDAGWSRHIRQGWRRGALQEALAGVSGLALQPDVKQGPFKLSYNVKKGRPSPVADVEGLLRARGLHARLIYSQDAYLDVLPVRASKGLAIRYLAYKHGVALRSFLVAGDSGNDTGMLLGDTLGVVVGNHQPELEPLRESDQVYFARRHHAGGILEGIEHYQFAGEEPAPADLKVACLAS